ncbi:MAG: ABC transporter substrate-binding protein, partial [Nonomuraea sp.]|nr:ABC transporter substrate-binding protein [Nonomuraea sp.]
DLRGARVALPGWAATKAESFPRAMALHGAAGALAQGGLSLDDVTFVEVAASTGRREAWNWPGIAELADGTVDAVYVKGARAAEQAAAHGFAVAVDLDAHPDVRTRVNNGTPRPITVHADLAEERPDLVVDFLEHALRAADWAADHPQEVRAILARETGSGAEGVRAAYRGDFHTRLHPTLDAERLGLLWLQKDFLLEHGFLAANVDLGAWAAPRFLARAAERLNAGATV